MTPASGIWLARGLLVVALALEVMPLPDSLLAWRPPWVAMAIIYWSMMWPRRFGLGTGWVMGLALDILHGNLLGAHALAFTVLAWLTHRFHLQIRLFPLWQLTAAVFSLLAISAFIQFWIDGIAGITGNNMARWTQVLSGALVWPFVMGLMDRARMTIETRKQAMS